jgi:hypothetical protein
MPAQPLDQLGPPQQQAGLRPAEELVAAGGDQVRASAEGGVGVGLIRQQWLRGEQAAADVGDHRHAEPGQLRHRRRGGEALDAEVAGVHLEDATGVRAERRGVVGGHRAVGRADLAEPRAGARDQLGQAEAVTDLDHLTAADDDLAAGGQCRRRQHQRGGPVVDHEHRSGSRHRLLQRGQRPTAPARPPSGLEVVLHVGVGRRPEHGLDGSGGERCPPEVGVQHDTGGVQNRPRTAQ